MDTPNKQVRLTNSSGGNVPVSDPSRRVTAQLRANELAAELTRGDNSDEALIFRSRAARGAKATFGDVSIEITEEE